MYTTVYRANLDSCFTLIKVLLFKYLDAKYCALQRPRSNTNAIPVQDAALGSRGGNFHLARVGPTHPARHMGHTTRDS